MGGDEKKCLSAVAKFLSHCTKTYIILRSMPSVRLLITAKSQQRMSSRIQIIFGPIRSLDKHVCGPSVVHRYHRQHAPIPADYRVP